MRSVLKFYYDSAVIIESEAVGHRELQQQYMQNGSSQLRQLDGAIRHIGGQGLALKTIASVTHVAKTVTAEHDALIIGVRHVEA